MEERLRSLNTTHSDINAKSKAKHSLMLQMANLLEISQVKCW